MQNQKRLKLLVAFGALFSVVAIATPQVKEIIKVIGVGAAVDRFGGDMNKALNRLTKHTDSAEQKTRVVPILSVGIGRGSSAIGAAQVSGPPAFVDQVKAVAAPETGFGDLRLRALIPVSDKNVLKGIKRVKGVGVSGVVDLKL